MSDSKNGRARIQFTHQEIEAMRTLVRDRLGGKITSMLTDKTLGGLLIKVARASERLKASG